MDKKAHHKKRENDDLIDLLMERLLNFSISPSMFSNSFRLSEIVVVGSHMHGFILGIILGAELSMSNFFSVRSLLMLDGSWLLTINNGPTFCECSLKAFQ